MHYGAGHHERRGQKPALRGALPRFCAGWVQGGPVQEPEHGPEQLCHPRWAGNGPRSGGAGPGGGHRAGRPDEPHSAQAQQRCRQPGHRQRRGAGPDESGGLLPPQKTAHPRYFNCLQQPGGGGGHHRHRGCRQPGGDQPQGGRHRQHGAGQTGGCPRPAGRRYRPGRRVRPALRHCGAAGAGGAGPHSGTHHQQIPGGCGNSAPGPDHAGRKNAPARAGRGALPERGH